MFLWSRVGRGTESKREDQVKDCKGLLVSGVEDRLGILVDQVKRYNVRDR